MSKLLVFIIFSITFIFSFITPVFANFSDISSDHHLYTYIKHLQEKQLIAGYPDGTFKPNAPISRAELVALTFRTKGIEEHYPVHPTFSDLPPNHWAYGIIEAAFRDGIICGYSDKTFRPENTVTIAEMATILVNLAGLISEDIDNSIYFTELNGHWAEEKIRIAIAYGFIEAFVDGFEPNSPATRGQAAFGLVKAITVSTEVVIMEENVEIPEQKNIIKPSRSSKTTPSYIIEVIEILGATKQDSNIFTKNINQGEDYFLPTNVKVLLSNNIIKNIAVNWEFSSIDTQECGEIYISGSLAGYDYEITLIINIFESIPDSQPNLPESNPDPEPDPIVEPPVDNGSDGNGDEPENPTDIVEVTINFNNEAVFINNQINGTGQLKVNGQAVNGAELEIEVIKNDSIIDITDILPMQTNNEGYFNISFIMPENLYGEFTLKVIYLEEIFGFNFIVEEPVYTGREYFVFDSSTGTITNYNTNGGYDVLIPPTIDGISVTAIGPSAFKNKNLNSIVIPNSVTTIGDEAFRNNNFTNLTIPYNVTHIGRYAFTSNLIDNLILPDSLISIGNGAFAVNKLKKVTIPDSITTLADSLFYKNELTDVIFPNNLNTIGQYAFRYNKLTNIVLPNNVTKISAYAFSDNLLESVHLPNSIKAINIYAFNNNNLTHISLPYGLTSIDNSVFRNNKLTSVDIPNTVTIIYNYAFENNNLSSITLPNSVTNIGIGALQNNNITSITLGADVIIGNNLLNSSNNNFREAYNNIAGTYIGTQTGPWCLSPP